VNDFPSSESTGETLAAAVLRGAATYPSTALVWASESRPAESTLSELVADARRVAAALQRRGVGPGDVVAVQLPNWYEGAVAQAAVALCGAVLLPVVQIYGPREVGFILRQSGAVAYFVPGEWRGRDYAAMLPELGELPALHSTVVVGGPPPAGAIAWDELLAAPGEAYSVPDIEPSALAMLVYTSGTTAEPKGVQHSHATLLAEVYSATMLRGAGPGAVNLAVFPSGHVAGLLGLLRILVLGTPTVLMDVWDAHLGAELIDKYCVVSSVGAPVHLAALLAERDRGFASLDTLADYMVGAASVPPSLVSRADAAGIAAFRCYGSSEHPTISSGDPSDPAIKRATTDGRVLPGNEVRVIDDDGADVPAGCEGELITRGPELFVGYRDAALNAEAFLPGRWFRTGDIGRLDADGFLTITDRKKDVIVRGGENLSSKEIEDILASHPKVAEVAVVAFPDDRYGERVCAFVVPAEGASIDLAEVVEHFRQSGAARQKTPERLEIVSSLPRTAAGKIQKFVLRAQV
jgi:cyclohexanecarboxylate-CoA ligase